MTPDTGGTTQLLRRVRAGDVLAHNALIAHARQRIVVLTSYMLRRFPPCHAGSTRTTCSRAPSSGSGRR
jgi:hypothetical protein